MGQMDLAAISSNPDQKVKAAQYKEVLEKLLKNTSVEDMKAFIDHSAFTRPAASRLPG
jgi:phosphoribosylformylglycinamidine (FGAM) synthase PurS component